MSEVITESYKTLDLNKIHARRMNQNAAGVGVEYNDNWYHKLMVNTGQLSQRLRRYKEMDGSVDISRALDIMAEDVSSTDGSDDKMFILKYEDSGKFNKQQLTALNVALNKWKKATAFDIRFFDYIRDTLKNGMVIFRKGKKGKLKHIKPERIDGYMVAKDDPDTVTHYLYNPHASFENKNRDTLHIADAKEKSIAIPVDELMIIKIGEGAYGNSILDKVYRAWRQLMLLEDAVIIYRIVRAPERRIFSIDVGSMPAKKAEAYIESVKNKMKQKSVIRNGEISADYNPASMQEDIYLGTTGDGRGSRVETLAGGDNLGRIEDLMYFSKKLATALRIPPSYLDIYSAELDGGQASDGRVGTAYMAELRYVGYIRRLQKELVVPLFEHFKKYAKELGVVVPEDVCMDISPPQSFAIYKENEINSALLNVFGSADSIMSLSKREALRRFAGYSEEDLVRNEHAKLLELGYDEKQIKKMKDHEKFNKIYNDGTMFPNEREDEDDDMGGLGSFGATPKPEPKPEPEPEPKKEVGKGGGFASRNASTPSNIYKSREELGLEKDEKHPADKTDK